MHSMTRSLHLGGDDEKFDACVSFPCKDFYFRYFGILLDVYNVCKTLQIKIFKYH